MIQGEKEHSFWPWQPLILLSVLAFGIIMGGTLNIHDPDLEVDTDVKNKKWLRSKTDHYKLVKALRYIETQYIEDVNADDLMDIALQAVFDSLDPHSFYISKSEFQEISDRTRGDFEGIGVEYVRIDDTIVVMRVMDEGPAQKAGIRSGDMILTANGVNLANVEETDSIQSLIKGPSGSSVQLIIRHPRSSEAKIFEVERGKIPYHSVEYSGKLDSEVLYVKLRHFNGNAYSEFMNALEEHADGNRIEKLIIDVRDNPGGYLSEVVKILSQLFDERDRLLVYTENRNGVQKEYKSTGKNFYSIGDIAVIVNSNSASASEILAGALQDWERGVIFGQRTYGKGLVQEQFNLEDGSALRLTTAKYLTPSGRMIQRPYHSADYNNSNNRRLKNGEFYFVDSIQIIDSVSFKTQYGSPLLSGEGIIPDIFIPLDSLLFSDCYMWASNYYQKFVYEYTFKKRNNGFSQNTNDLFESWRKFIQEKENFEMHCSNFETLKPLFIQTLWSQHFLYSNKSENEFIELLDRDENVQAVLEFWEKGE